MEFGAQVGRRGEEGRETTQDVAKSLHMERSRLSPRDLVLTQGPGVPVA